MPNSNVRASAEALLAERSSAPAEDGLRHVVDDLQYTLRLTEAASMAAKGLEDGSAPMQTLLGEIENRIASAADRLDELRPRGPRTVAV